MADAKAAWEQAGTALSNLGVMLQQVYDEAAAKGEADRGKVGGALHGLADSLDIAMQSLGASVQSTQFREQARSAGASLLDALAVSFAELGQAMRRLDADSAPTDSTPDALPCDDTHRSV